MTINQVLAELRNSLFMHSLKRLDLNQGRVRSRSCLPLTLPNQHNFLPKLFSIQDLDKILGSLDRR